VHPEIWARWSDIVGEDLARRALPRAFYNNTLILSVATSAWLQQLTYLKAVLLERFDEEIGPDVVKDIRLNLDPAFVRGCEADEQNERPAQAADSPLDPDMHSAIQKIEDPELRESIERAARASLASRRPNSR
jgi:hypothetical protein